MKTKQWSKRKSKPKNRERNSDCLTLYSGFGLLVRTGNEPGSVKQGSMLRFVDFQRFATHAVIKRCRFLFFFCKLKRKRHTNIASSISREDRDTSTLASTPQCRFALIVWSLLNFAPNFCKFSKVQNGFKFRRRTFDWDDQIEKISRQRIWISLSQGFSWNAIADRRRRRRFRFYFWRNGFCGKVIRMFLRSSETFFDENRREGSAIANLRLLNFNWGKLKTLTEETPGTERLKCSSL